VHCRGREPGQSGVAADALGVVDQPAPRDLTCLLDQGVRGVDINADDVLQPSGQAPVKPFDVLVFAGSRPLE
jgi:hypothetical protein